MKKYFVFISLIYATILPLNGQSGFILAGQDTGLMYTRFSTPKWIFDALLYFDSESFSIDIDNDGRPDVELKYYEGIHGEDDGIQYMEMIALHAGVQFSVTYDTLVDNFGASAVYGVTSSYNLNDTMGNQGMVWSDSSVFINYYNSDDDPYSIGGSGAFVGGRIIKAGDSSLFYMRYGLFGFDSTHQGPSYRLYEYAIQGSDTAITIPTSINVVNDMAEIKVYPNPFNGQINFTSGQSMEFMISDYMGRIVKQGKSDNVISTDELPMGEYVLFLKSTENSYVVKVVK